MIKHIIIYETSHYQDFFPLTRFRGVWDLPTGIFSLRQQLNSLFPQANLFFSTLEGREYLIHNPLSGTRAFDTRAGIKIQEGQEFKTLRRKIKEGEKILVVHANWFERELLIGISKNPGAKVYAQIFDLPLLGIFIFDKRIQKSQWWQNMENQIDPLPPGELPGEFCIRYPWEILALLEKNITSDFSILNSESFVSTPLPSVQGPRAKLLMHPSAKIAQGVTLDTSGGPIVIDYGTKITGPSNIEGPVYIGPNSNIDGAKLRGNSYLGHTCKIAGEIENSLIMDFSNKHHDGFLGHSLVGSWVNFGSLSNTSDLKNNYGSIKMWNRGRIRDTGLIKLGSVIGDFVKIAIGIQINTGSTIDVGANLFGQNVSDKYTSGFAWGNNSDFYKLDRFLEDSEKILKRRDQALDKKLKNQIRETHKALTFRKE